MRLFNSFVPHKRNILARANRIRNSKMLKIEHLKFQRLFQNRNYSLKLYQIRKNLSNYEINLKIYID